MSEIQLPIIITKKDCSRCIELKDWMKENNFSYVEQDIEDEKFVHQLLHDPNFVKMFCDEEGCVVNTPVVMFKGKYYLTNYGEYQDLRKKKLKNSLKIFLKCN